MEKKKIFIHIGYPKTGTTTIQKHFFPKIEEAQFINKFFDSGHSAEHQNIIEELINKKNSVIDFQKLSNTLTNTLVKEKVIISSENFLFNSFIPEKFYNTTIFSSPLEVVKNIRELFDESKYDVRIIIVIRRQDEMISSLYAQGYSNTYANFKEYNTFKKYLNIFTQNKNHIFRASLNYDNLVSSYQATFGDKNVNVLVFEKLKNNTSAFYSRLCEILEIDKEKYGDIAINKYENARVIKGGFKKTHDLTLRTILRRVRFNYLPFIKIKLSSKQREFLDSITLNKNLKINKTIHIEPFEKKLILDVYSKSNSNLSERFDLNLEDYGYFTK